MKGYREYMSADNRSSSESDLVLEHLGLVQRIALHLKARLPDFVELEELVQIGMIGLMEAFQSFDVSQGDDLGTYASKRIRGAILDEVRRRSPLSRQDNDHTKNEEQAIEQFKSIHGHAPAASEIAELMGVSVDEYHRSRTKSHTFQMSSFEEMSEQGMEIEVQDNSPEEEVSQQENIELLVSKIAHLTERDQLILSLYYNEEMNLKEIGAILEISESRVSQLLTKIVSQLRDDVRF